MTRVARLLARLGSVSAAADASSTAACIQPSAETNPTLSASPRAPALLPASASPQALAALLHLSLSAGYCCLRLSASNQRGRFVLSPLICAKSEREMTVCS